MNDKWNPRLWLRNWLLRPSHAETARINATAQGVPKAVAYSRPISACDFTLDLQDGRVVGLKVLPPQSQ